MLRSIGADGPPTMPWSEMKGSMSQSAVRGREREEAEEERDREEEEREREEEEREQCLEYSSKKVSLIREGVCRRRCVELCWIVRKVRVRVLW
jgi:hypothetical protein